VTLVVDASLVVAALVNKEATGAWAERILASEELIAPHLLPAECASVLRRLQLRNDITAQDSQQAFAELQSLRVGLLPFHPFAQRIWELWQTVTPYDAWYVAMAEAYELELATADRRLTRAPGPRCRFVTPPNGT
jgi:predicted nucleic acid-binding protein